MEYNFQADIGADIGDFMKGVKQVDAEIRDLATGVEIDFEAEIGDVMKDVQLIEKEIDDLTQTDKEIDITSNIHDFVAGATAVHREAERLDGWNVRIDIDAYIMKAQMAISLIQARLRMLTWKDFTVRIRASWDNYRLVMGQIANFSRNIGEVTQIMGRGGLMFLSPAMVPVIASAAGLIGQLGPMLGTILGSSFALATSFGAAGIGAAGFAAVAIPALKGVFDKAGEITDLEMKIADAKAVGDIEKANEHLAEMDRIFKGMSGPQLEAHSALRDFQGTYSQLVKDMEPGVVEAFGGSLKGITSVLGLARPMIENVVGSVNNLVDSFNRSLEAQDVKDFFSFLGDFAGPALETIAKAAGNFTMGLFNMMEAFGPLATETQNSFLKMSESFRQWADGLSESEKFQSFVDYVSENMPKIRSIFSDAIQGIINMFAAFAPSSADMMSGLQDMMERFKEWSAALGESKGFQNFIDYIKTNGPVVLSVIGGLVDFIINLGKALAPTGEYLLNMVDRFLDWSNAMMEAHPQATKIVGVAFAIAAGLVAIAPAVLLVNAMFGGLIIGAIKLVARIVWATLMIIGRFALMGAQALIHGARVGAAWLLTTGANMVVALAKMAASAAIFIAKWALMGVKALLHAAKVAAAWLLTTGASMVTALAKMAVTTAIFVAKWVFMGAQALLQAARMAAAWFIALGPVGWVIGIVVGLAILIIANWDKIAAWTSKTWTQIWSWIKEKWASIKATTSEAVTNMLSTVARKFAEIVSNVREKMENAKSTIRDKWEEAKNTTREKLQALLSAAKELFAKVVSTISEKMGEAVRKVAEFVGKMPGEVTKFVGEMLSAGGDLVNGLIDGIKGMGTAAINAVAGVVDGVVSKAKSLLNINSPSRVFRDIGQYVSEGLAIGVNNKAGMAVKNVAAMANGMTNAFNPQLAMADMNASANLDTSISRADMGVVRKSFAAEIPSVEVAERDIHLSVDGKKFAKFTAKPMQEEMDRNTAQRNVSKRGHN